MNTKNNEGFHALLNHCSSLVLIYIVDKIVLIILVKINVMVGCSAIGCSNNNHSKNRDLSFHRLPKNKELRKKWLHARKRVDIEDGQNVVLCSTHFIIEDFQRDLIPSFDRDCINQVLIKSNTVDSNYQCFHSFKM